MPQKYKYLTDEQVEQFLRDGYVVIENAFSPEKAADFTREVWVRLGMDPQDKTTWTRERTNMPAHRYEPVSTFSPKAWGAMLDLLGGAERVDEKSGKWGDSFIVNLGSEALEGQAPPDPRDLDNWHVDGDFFMHFLDSPEQALLVTPLFSDIVPHGGGTCIAPAGIPAVARYLAAHPEGLVPTGLTFTPSTSKYAAPEDDPAHFSVHALVRSLRREDILELTGNIGDVVLMHPLMPHSASRNNARAPRIITNPHVELRAPFRFDHTGADGDEYSLVEQKTLRALGRDSLKFEITSERREVVPKRLEIYKKMMEEEERRLAEARVIKSTGVPVETAA